MKGKNATKVGLEIVRAVLLKKLAGDDAMKVYEEIQLEACAAADFEAANRAAKDRVKRRFIVLSAEGRVDALGNGSGWVLGVPEDGGFDAQAAVRRAACEFNRTPAGRRMPVKSIAEALEFVPARFFKNEGVQVKTKQETEILATKGEVYEK